MNLDDLNKGIEKLNNHFNLIKAPINIRRILADDKDFIKFIKTGSVDEQLSMLEAFEKSEMYNDCCIIRDVINQKI